MFPYKSAVGLFIIQILKALALISQGCGDLSGYLLYQVLDWVYPYWEGHLAVPTGPHAYWTYGTTHRGTSYATGGRFAAEIRRQT